MEPNIVLGLAKRRGFFYPSFEIYGGMAGMFDYGPLGSLMKHNIENVWRDYYVVKEGCAEIRSPVISPEDVFKASGHLTEFTDFSVQCEKCKDAFRADHLIEEFVENADSLAVDELASVLRKNDVKCPTCGGDLGVPEAVNLMFKTQVGPVGGRAGYLRPETAQAMFFNFHLLYRHFREKLPFGVVQLGSGYRNEISPRQGLTRLREFNMMEAEVFFDPDDKKWPGYDAVSNRALRLVPDGKDEVTLSLADAVSDRLIANEPLAYFMWLTQDFLLKVGLDPARLRFRQHKKTEMAHYATDCWDCEALTGYGWLELVGVADRGCYDLSGHIKHSGAELTAFIRFDEPREMDVVKVRPKRNVLGPMFKEKAGKIADALEKMDGSQLVEGKPISVDVDGEKIEVPIDCFEVATMRDKVSGRRIVPHVVEPSYGLDRIFYTIVEHNYREAEEYVTMTLPTCVAPYKFGVFPLMSKDGLDRIASDVHKTLQDAGIVTYYDESGTIGRRYARMDEAGTPYCITADYESKDDAGVTIRDRDTKEQKRVKIEDIASVSKGLLDSTIDFKSLG